MSTNPDHQALFNRVMRLPDKISARHLDAAIASTADGREALRQVAQSDRFASHWCEQEPREAASAVSEIQESEATERKRRFGPLTRFEQRLIRRRPQYTFAAVFWLAVFAALVKVFL